jgi:hypothetical protein
MRTADETTDAIAVLRLPRGPRASPSTTLIS